MRPEARADRSPEPLLGEEERFLADLSRALHAVSAPSGTIEGYVHEVGDALGLSVEIVALQGMVVIAFSRRDGSRVMARRIPFQSDWNLRRTSELIALARGMAARDIDFEHGRARLEAILAEKPMFPTWLIVVAYAGYGMATAARVGGRWIEMCVAGVVGVIAGLTHREAAKLRAFSTQQTFVVALLGTLVVLGLAVVLPPMNLVQALFGGIVLTVPAMVVAIAADELASGDLESGVARLGYGIIRFVMIGLGVLIGTKGWTIFGPLPESVTPHRLPDPLILVLLVGGALALSVCLTATRSQIAGIVLGVLAAWGTQALTILLFGAPGDPTVAAFLLGLVALLYARLSGDAPATVVIPGLLQLAPGFLGTRTIVGLVEHTGTEGSGGVSVLLAVLQLFTGLLLAFVVGRRARRPASPEALS